MNPIRFKSTLVNPDDHFGWHFIRVPARIGSTFEKKDGTRRIVCTINGVEPFQCALVPSSEGDFLIVVNKAKRTKLRIAAGDKLDVEIKRDESKYGLPMPAEFKEVLKQDRVGNKYFHALTPGKQRSILWWIGKIKDIDKRIHTALVFIEHLKRNNGKIVHDELTAELKRPAL